METTVGQLLVVWSARLVVGCFLLRYLWPVLAGRNAASRRWVLRIWAAAWLLLLVHVGFAFHFIHGWSHSAAYEHTARQTAAVTGLNWGGGVYFNYALLVVWGADVVRSIWHSQETPASYRNSMSSWSLTVQIFVAAMMLFATVVFGPIFWTWIAAGFAVVMAILLGRTTRDSSDNEG